MACLPMASGLGLHRHAIGLRQVGPGQAAGIPPDLVLSGINHGPNWAPM